MTHEVTIALAGNPNVGKSTIFNVLTGSRQHVGNWPGKTVEKKSGTLKLGEQTITVVDLPGTYSLSAYSLEEQIARDFIVTGRPALVIHVLDATNLERNLYLTAQLLDTGTPLLLVLNMMDMTRERKLAIDAAQLSHALNSVPVVEMTASQSKGFDSLKQALAAVLYQIGEQQPVMELSA